MLKTLLSPDANLQRENTQLRADNARFLEAVTRRNAENIRSREETRQLRLQNNALRLGRQRDGAGRFA